MKRLTVSNVRGLNFGRHIGRSFDNLDSPFVVIYGANESGKSTLAEFLTWAIGGPWRSAAKNSDIFRIKSGDDVYGNVSATLDDELLEFEARFRLLKSGIPNDKRRGVFAGREYDSAGIRNSFGGITADEYQLIYRFYGGSLGDIGSGVEFSNLFSSFAMGSTSPTLNPRQALERIEARCKSLETSIKDETKKLKEFDKLIVLARRAPEEIALLETKIQEFTVSIDERATHTQQMIAELDLISRLISGLSQLNDKERAEGEIQSLPTISREMQAVTENLSDLEHLSEKTRRAESAARDERRLAEKAIAECGLMESSISDRTFSPIERVEVAAAARALSEAVARKSTAELAVKAAEGARTDKQLEVERECRQIGLQERQLADLDAISSDLPSLSDRAGRWAEQVNAAIEDEAKLAASKKIPDLGVGAEGRRGLPPVGIAAGLVLVALAGLAHPIAGVTVAVVLAGFALFFQTGNSQLKFGGAGATDDGAVATNLARDAEGHRKQAESHHALLLNGLGPLANLIEDPDTSRARISLLTATAEMRRQLVKLSAELQSAQSEASKAANALATAEQNAKGILGARDIPLSLVDQNFETWLAKYESAVLALMSSTSAQRYIDELQQKVMALLAPISGEIAGLEPNAVIERVRDAHNVEGRRKNALQRVREAELAISVANLDSPAARALLDKFDDESKLHGQREYLSSEITTAKEGRDREVAERAKLEADRDQRSGVEVLPGLNLAKSQCEEAIDEAKHQLTAATVALKVLRETIDRYERENQDPVVAAASALINKVVPNWGSVMFSRDDKQDPVLDRADNDGRLNEKLLSDGARALLYLGIRLAFAQKDADKRGVALPLICDDPLVQFDDDRSVSALQLLAEFSKNHQVVLFTCETSTREMASRLGAAVLEI